MEEEADMGKEFRILAVNVGSTSTKIGLFKETLPIITETITYSSDDLAQYEGLREQLPRREEDLYAFLRSHDVNLQEIDIVISRGGLGRPGPAGAYQITDSMCEDLLEGKYGKHPSALGPAMARDMSQKLEIPAIVMDPPSTDEFQALARITGLPEIERKSAFHALNQKAAARRAAAALGKKYDHINFVVAHLGGGITIGAHKKGLVIDCTHGLSEGPFTPERAGSLPTLDLIELAVSGTSDSGSLHKKMVGQGGLMAYLGTSDARQVQDMVRNGDKQAELIYHAMAYQVAKDIGSMYAVLKGNVQGIVLTGGLAQSELFTRWIEEWISALAPVFVYPGEDEMLAMAEGAVRVLRGEEVLKQYD